MTRPAILAACALLICITAQSAPRLQPAGSAEVSLDGTAVALPEMKDSGEYQVRLSGTFECGIDGRRYDARYRQDAAGHFTQPHGLVVLDPPAESITEDTAKHTFTFGPVPGKDNAGESVTVRVDVDRLVDEFIRTPSEVRESLTGELRAELLYAPPTVPPSVLVPAIALPLFVAVFVISALVNASRRATRRPYEDVHALRRRIQRKARLALQEVGTREILFEHLREQLRELGRAADELARHVLTFRATRLAHDEQDVQEDIERLENDLTQAASDAVRNQINREVAHKQETLQYLRANAEREADYLLRLSRTETTLDNLRLKLPHLRLEMDARLEQPVADEVESELELLRAAVQQTREMVIGEDATETRPHPHPTTRQES